MPPPLPSARADDMLGDFFKPCSSSWRPTLCPWFPPIQPFLTAATEDPSSLTAPVKTFMAFTRVEGWTTFMARGIPRLESSLAALLPRGRRVAP
ncbi:hypothetical protein NHX12_006180 [Muraenolepis orangiensis]|uniref:Uncharacterized protein n=1 Tax=Muraenolepis orangiensis TaxID=630683 RepID=A0A9Q0IEB2_9TELE|nr:hypothetical protein NHX12_006180 [Muraenolepis orangiensis]